MTPTPEQINEAKATLQKAGFLQIFWTMNDITRDHDSTRPPLTFEEKIDVAEYLERTHDASIGINWDVITAAVQTVFP